MKNLLILLSITNILILSTSNTINCVKNNKKNEQIIEKKDNFLNNNDNENNKFLYFKKDINLETFNIIDQKKPTKKQIKDRIKNLNINIDIEKCDLIDIKENSAILKLPNNEEILINYKINTIYTLKNLFLKENINNLNSFNLGNIKLFDREIPTKDEIINKIKNIENLNIDINNIDIINIKKNSAILKSLNDFVYIGELSLNYVSNTLYSLKKIFLNNKLPDNLGTIEILNSKTLTKEKIIFQINKKIKNFSEIIDISEIEIIIDDNNNKVLILPKKNNLKYYDHFEMKYQINNSFWWFGWGN